MLIVILQDPHPSSSCYSCMTRQRQKCRIVPASEDSFEQVKNINHNHPTFLKQFNTALLKWIGPTTWSCRFLLIKTRLLVMGKESSFFKDMLFNVSDHRLRLKRIKAPKKRLCCTKFSTDIFHTGDMICIVYHQFDRHINRLVHGYLYISLLVSYILLRLHNS